MARWRACVSALGGSEQFDRRDGIEQSMDGDLLRFDYWRFSGTPFEGTSVMRIGAQGVLHERITYRSLTGVRSFLRGEAGLALNNQDVR